MTTFFSAWTLVGLLSLLPFVSADYRWDTGGVVGLGEHGLEFGILPAGLIGGLVRLVFGIGPFCAALGFLTPLLVDRWSGGDPDRAGSAYAINVLGSLIGPLLAGFVLLPFFGERGSLLILALPLFAAGLHAALKASRGRAHVPRLAFAGSVALSIGCMLGTRMFEDQFEEKEVRHDSTATVVAIGEGLDRRLLVNGVGITTLTPMTKMMAHLPMAWSEKKPESSLVICFGMGTSFRSLASWGSATTGVELVPSVPELFSYFHTDTEEILANPENRIVVDDGRRFLERTDEVFDVITLDPPPPPEAAGSSLLYSVEFNRALKKRLAPGGILQHWCPTDEVDVQLGVWESLAEVFEHVKVFRGMDGWGFHFLASDSPLPERTAKDLADNTPEAAKADLIEWGPEGSALEQYQRLMDNAFPDFGFYAEKFDAEPILDDRPLNEYFFLRRAKNKSVTN